MLDNKTYQPYSKLELDRFDEIIKSYSFGKINVELQRIISEKKKLINIIMSSQKNKKSFALRNFLLASLQCIDLVTKISETLKIKQLAFYARELYELRLWLKYACLSEENLDEWLIIESQRDKTDIFDALKKLTALSPVFQKEHDALNKGKADISKLLDKNEMKISERNNPPRGIAKAIGERDDHDIFYKILTKFTHPSSFLINELYDKNSDPELVKFLLIHITLYGWDIHDICNPEVIANK